MINTELLLGYIVKSKRKIVDIAELLNLSEIGFIKRVGNMADFNVCEVNRLCDILNIPRDDALHVFFK